MKKPDITGIEHDWNWNKLGQEDLVIHLGIGKDEVDGFGLCTVYALSNDDEGVKEMEANAKAISAVPKMIDALIGMHEYIFSREPGDDLGFAEDTKRIINLIEQALKKAGVKYE